jgi:hypothetical protein
MVDDDDGSVCSACCSSSSSSSTSINWIGSTDNFDVVFTDKKTKQIRNDLGWGVRNGKVIHVLDLTNDDNDHSSVSATAPSSPSSVQFLRVTPPSSSVDSVLYE